MKSMTDQMLAIVQKRTIARAKDVYETAANMTDIAYMSPVWTGSFVASWRAKIGEVDTSYTYIPTQDIQQPLKGKPWPGLKYESKKLDTIYISNSIFYASEIQEEGTAYSDPDILNRILEHLRW